MEILKFGGESLVHAQHFFSIQEILKQNLETPKTLVVSGYNRSEDKLTSMISKASSGDSSFKSDLVDLEQSYLDLVKTVFKIDNQSRWLSLVKKNFNDIEEFINSIYILEEFTEKTKAKVVGIGKVLTTELVYGYLSTMGFLVTNFDVNALHIHSDSQLLDKKKLSHYVKDLYQKSGENSIYLVPGGLFVQNDAWFTFPKGGDDYTASCIAECTNAMELQIWTGDSGFFTADPALVSHAKQIEYLSYQEAMELSHFGTEVFYPPMTQGLRDKNIPTKILDINVISEAGTLIQDLENVQNSNTAVGISHLDSMALLTLEGSGMVGIPGVSAKFFGALSEAKVNVVLITQSSSEHNITIAILENQVDQAIQVLNEKFRDELERQKIDPIEVERNLSIVALVGANMKNKTGVSGKLFSALGSNGINVRAIAQGSSEKNISVVITKSDVQKAVNVLYERFFDDEIKQVHVYLCGVGNVGSKLLEQIQNQNTYLQEHLKMNLNIAGVSNSKKMNFHDRGFSFNDLKEVLDSGVETSPDKFVDEILQRNKRNAVFVDVTASQEVAEVYEKLLQKSINIVACNKIAAASEYSKYKKLKTLAKNNNCNFFFETNVGASLPIIGTMNDLVRSGDQVLSIQAVLSGTMNFVFNTYDGNISFAEVVKQAQNEGYTEPDPRQDLSGTDVARKILILAREAGYQLNFEDIEIQSFLPESCMQGSVGDFYKELENYEAYFKNLLNSAKSEGKRLKFVANFSQGKASIGLQHIDSTSDLYHLYGKDNIVILKTQRYQDQPLVIKGAGAGAEVTASGVFSDVVRSV